MFIKVNSFKNYLKFEDFILYPYRTLAYGIRSLIDAIRDKIFSAPLSASRNSLEERVSKKEEDVDHIQQVALNRSYLNSSVIIKNSTGEPIEQFSQVNYVQSIPYEDWESDEENEPETKADCKESVLENSFNTYKSIFSKRNDAAHIQQVASNRSYLNTSAIIKNSAGEVIEQYTQVDYVQSIPYEDQENGEENELETKADYKESALKDSFNTYKSISAKKNLGEKKFFDFSEKNSPSDKKIPAQSLPFVIYFLDHYASVIGVDFKKNKRVTKLLNRYYPEIMRRLNGYMILDNDNIDFASKVKNAIPKVKAELQKELEVSQSQ